jgi:transposase
VLSFPAAIKVYLCTVACDLRRSFDGLAMMAEHIIGCNPFSGHLLVFCNRRSDRVKILYWDRDGWAVWYKRLEAGSFQFPFAATGRREIAAWELGLLLEGIGLSWGRRPRRPELLTQFFSSSLNPSPRASSLGSPDGYISEYCEHRCVRAPIGLCHQFPSALIPDPESLRATD